TGTYLFGKPVPRGHVRVTRWGEHGCDLCPREKQPAAETIAEGDAGDDGVYTAELQLGDLRKLGEGERFQDIHLAAFVTDPSSNRTEQRRFDIRVTNEPIHVYVFPGAAAQGRPAVVYVSTDYADGRAASTQVEIR